MAARRCKKCGSIKNSVKDSRKENGEIRRKIECVDCGATWITYEVTKHDYESLRKAKFEMKMRKANNNEH